VPDLAVCPARLAGGRTTNQTESVLRGRGFGGACTHTCNSLEASCGVQLEHMGVKHGNYCNGLWLSAAWRGWGAGPRPWAGRVWSTFWAACKLESFFEYL